MTIIKRVNNKVTLKDGTVQRSEADLYSKLNYNIIRLVNKTETVGEYGFPILTCNIDFLPDYIALYTQPCDYHKTKRTAIAFYNYDNTFDGLNGLYNSIYYNDKKQIDYFKQRFAGVKYFIMPDYSVFADISQAENIYRYWKMRIVSLWLVMELNAVVIPNASYTSIDDFSLSFSGYEKCSVIAFSLKGHMSFNELQITKEAIKYAVDNLSLKTIVVYSVCNDNSKVYDIFDYAIKFGVNISIPNNSLQERNMTRRLLV